MQPTDQDRPTTDNSTDGHIPRRVSVPEAALLLGISEDAVRSRLRRGTLRKEKAADGPVYVILNGTVGADRPTTDADRSTTDNATDEPDALGMLDLMREQVEHLRDQLDQEREANRENRRIIMQMAQRIPQLEAAPATPHGPESAAEAGESPAARDRGEDAQESAPPRSSWWRWLFSS